MLLDDIGSYLQSHGYGRQDVDLFKGTKPAEPDNLIALFEYAGEPRELIWNGGPTIEHPGLQIWCRSKSYPAGRVKLEQITQALHGFSGVLGTTNYLLIRANQSPESLGKDSKGRNEWVVNFSVEKEVG